MCKSLIPWNFCFLVHFMAIVSLVIIKSPHNNNFEIHKYCGLTSEAEMALSFNGCGPKECKSELKVAKCQVLSPTLPLTCHREVVHALCSSFPLCKMKMIILSLTELWGLINAKGTVLGWIRIFAVRSVMVPCHAEPTGGSSFQWDSCFDKVNCRCRIVEKAWALRQVDLGWISALALINWKTLGKSFNSTEPYP